MTHYRYKIEGCCSEEITFSIVDGRISAISITGGCDGNIQGLMRLVQDMPVLEVISRLRGIDCEDRGTSCPDQLARALEAVMAAV